MWLIKLPFRILALPIMLIIGSIAIFYKLFLNVGYFMLGLVELFLAASLVGAIMQHSLLGVIAIVLTGAVVFLGNMFAEALSMGLEALTGSLCGFIFS